MRYERKAVQTRGRGGKLGGNRKLSVICTISRLTIRRRHTGRINAKSAVKIIPSQRHGLTSGVGARVTLT